MSTYGTSHFVDKLAAVRYFATYHCKYTARAVDRMIATGEIHIGPPTAGPGETVTLDASEGRYLICTAD